MLFAASERIDRVVRMRCSDRLPETEPLKLWRRRLLCLLLEPIIDHCAVGNSPLPFPFQKMVAISTT